jgi:hypothetical protein
MVAGLYTIDAYTADLGIDCKKYAKRLQEAFDSLNWEVRVELALTTYGVKVFLPSDDTSEDNELLVRDIANKILEGVF